MLSGNIKEKKSSPLAALIHNFLCTVIKDKSLPLDERNARAKEAIATAVFIKSNLNEKDKWCGETPLILASQNGCTAIVEALLAANADPNATDKFDATPLSRASDEGHVAIVKMLLTAKADPDLDTLDGGVGTPLCLASDSGHTAIVEALLEAKADPDKNNKHGNTALIEASRKGHHTIGKLLLAAKADPDKGNAEFEVTPLSFVSAQSCINFVEALLAAKANPNKANYGLPPLHCASQDGHSSVAEALLAAKAEVNLRDVEGFTPLDRSIKHSTIFTTHLLLKSHAEINDFNTLREFLFSQSQNDPYVIECFGIMLKAEKIQLERLQSLNHAYATFFSFFFRDISFNKDVTDIVLGYDGRFFKPSKLPPINISQPQTITVHLQKLKNEILKQGPGLFNKAIQEIDDALLKTPLLSQNKRKTFE